MNLGGLTPSSARALFYLAGKRDAVSSYFTEEKGLSLNPENISVTLTGGNYVLFTANFPNETMTEPLTKAEKVFNELNVNSTEREILETSASFNYSDQAFQIDISSITLSLSGTGGVDISNRDVPVPVSNSNGRPENKTDSKPPDVNENDSERSNGRDTSSHMMMPIELDDDSLDVTDEETVAKLLEECLRNNIMLAGGQYNEDFEPVIGSATADDNSLTVSRTNTSGEALLNLDAIFSGSEEGPNLRSEDVLQSIRNVINGHGGFTGFLNDVCLVPADAPARVQSAGSISTYKSWYGSDSYSGTSTTSSTRTSNIKVPDEQTSTINATMTLSGVNKTDVEEERMNVKSKLDSIMNLASEEEAKVEFDINDVNQTDGGGAKLNLGIVVRDNAFKAQLATEQLQRDAVTQAAIRNVPANNVNFSSVDASVSINNVGVTGSEERDTDTSTGSRVSVLPALVVALAAMFSMVMLAP